MQDTLKPLKLTVCLAASMAIGITLLAVDAKILGCYREVSSYFFQVEISSSSDGSSQFFYDIGQGIQEIYSSRSIVTHSDTLVTFRFPLPSGRYTSLRFDPIDRESRITISDPRITDHTGHTIYRFTSEAFRSVQQIATLTPLDTHTLTLTTTPLSFDPILSIELPTPLILESRTFSAAWSTIRIFFKDHMAFVLTSIFLALAFLKIWSLLHRGYTSYQENISTYIKLTPTRTLLLSATLATLLSCYPVVFAGKSFLSPNNGGIPLLYDRIPTLPGYDSASLEDPKGADLGAIMWAHWPYSVIQARSLFKFHEMPLWNRFNSLGTALLGQGQSMFGEPLHFMVLLAKGRAWAWDAKYVVAKFLFSLSIGLIAYAATEHLLTAIMICFSSQFIGFFVFRFNHPAFFSLCYAPWVLYSWMRLLDPLCNNKRLFFHVMLLVSNYFLITSGTIKEAYILLINMNITGILLLLFSQNSFKFKLKLLFHVLIFFLLLITISAPIWFSFTNTLSHSFSLSHTRSVSQISPAFVAGLFDEIFYRQLTPTEKVFCPSTNFLLLIGFLHSITNFYQMSSSKVFVSVFLSSLFCFFLVFGLISPSYILRIPFLSNLDHLHNIFSCCLVIYLHILAAFGISKFFSIQNPNQWKATYTTTIIMLFILLAVFLATGNFIGIHNSYFFYIYLSSITFAVTLLPFVLRGFDVSCSTSMRTYAMIGVCFFLLLWRHGMHNETRADPYVINPQQRADLLKESPAVNFIRQSEDQPYRVIGFDNNLYAGYSGVLEIEGIKGPDALINPYYRELSYYAGLNLESKWLLVTQWKDLPSLKPIYNMFNVKYFLDSSSRQFHSDSNLDLVCHLDMQVFRNDDAWPRAFFVDTIVPYGNIDEFITLLQERAPKPFAAMHEVDYENFDNRLQEKFTDTHGQTIPAHDYKLTNNKTSFKINAPSRGIAVLSEMYLDNDFEATLNGALVPYFRVNHAFKGIYIPAAGSYEVCFTFWPEYMSYSLIASALASFILLVIIIYATLYRSIRTSIVK